MMIKTFDGTEALRSECRYIKGAFYIKDKQCFFIKDKWYRINSNLIIFDHELESWVLVSEFKGVIGLVNYLNDKFVYGAFTRNPTKNLILGCDIRNYCPVDLPISLANHPARGRYVLDINVLKKSPYLFVENISTGRLSFIKESSSIIIAMGDKGNRADYEFRREYNVKRAPEILLYTYKQFPPSQYLTGDWGKFLPYSFGIEFETNKGFINENYVLQTGLVPLHDGSISGIEFATVPLSGTQGLNRLIDQCRVLQTYTMINEQCSTHLHLGGVKVRPDIVLALYRLGYLIQTEIYSMFPKAFEHTHTFKNQAKDYCNKLPNFSFATANQNSLKVYKELLSSIYKYEWAPGTSLFPDTHPEDLEENHKWRVESRYYYKNLVPLIFNTNRTVEFRIHIATLNPDKLINWIFICQAILKFAENNVSLLLNPRLLRKNFSLQRIITEAYPLEIADYLLKYVDWRKQMTADFEAQGDSIGKLEIQKDATLPVAPHLQSIFWNSNTFNHGKYAEPIRVNC